MEEISSIETKHSLSTLNKALKGRFERLTLIDWFELCSETCPDAQGLYWGTFLFCMPAHNVLFQPIVYDTFSHQFYVLFLNMEYAYLIIIHIACFFYSAKWRSAFSVVPSDFCMLDWETLVQGSMQAAKSK